MWNKWKHAVRDAYACTNPRIIINHNEFYTQKVKLFEDVWYERFFNKISLVHTANIYKYIYMGEHHWINNHTKTTCVSLCVLQYHSRLLFIFALSNILQTRSWSIWVSVGNYLNGSMRFIIRVCLSDLNSDIFMFAWRQARRISLQIPCQRRESAIGKNC